jgi:NADPH:quinone reductase-like Zn-dependent oxidoreductase
MGNRTVRLEDGFGIDHLMLRDLAADEPGAREARVRIEAISLNRRDLLLVEGSYNPRQTFPVVPCCDGAGIVEAVGPGCVRVKPGDRMAIHLFPRWLAGEPTSERLSGSIGGPGGDGTLRESMVITEDALVHLPASLTTLAAATLPCAALTAWSAVAELGATKPGDKVLLQGTGGVSLFALQFAKMNGATVIATTSSPAKAERLLALGADHVIDYRQNPDWARTARELADGRIDLIVDVGGADTLDASLRAIRPGGTIALIGVLSGVKASITLTLAVMRQVRLQGVTCGHRESFEAMVRAIEKHGVDPVIDARFALADAREAFRLMASNQHFGKIVIVP